MSKVVIVGCGAMGSVYAGLMQLAGHDVHGVCLWPDHVEAVNAHGLRVHGASGDHTVRLASMATSTARIGVSDLVVIATKAFDVETAAESCRPLIGPTTVIQSIQNGLGSPEKIAKILGAERLAIGVAGGFGASVPEPGVAHHNGMEMVRFGSRSLPHPDLEASATIWTSSGFTVKLYEDTDQMVWEKFIMNVAFSGTSCATGLSIGEVLANPSAWAVAEACAREAVAVAQAAGIRLDVGDPIAHVRSLGSKIPHARPSMLLDSDLKRRGEVDAIVGQVAVQGEKYGLDTPVTRTIANLIRARESDYLRRPLTDLHALDQVRGPRGRPH
jgi:2-dehydropantoate 2-reductase